VVLSIWFVLGLHWGVAGVAAATLIAEGTGLALGLYLARDAVKGLSQSWPRIADRAALKRMFGVSRDIMIRTVILQLSFTTFVFIGARFGDSTLAANQILLQFLGLTAYALDGIAFAAESLIGQAIGQNSRQTLRQAAKICLQWGFGGAAILALIFALAGTDIIDLMTTSDPVRTAAHTYLPWLVAAPLIGAAAWIYDGIFIGALMTGAMVRAALIVLALYIPALLILVPIFGNHGLWAALMLMNAARGLTLNRAFPRIEARLPTHPPKQL